MTKSNQEPTTGGSELAKSQDEVLLPPDKALIVAHAMIDAKNKEVQYRHKAEADGKGIVNGIRHVRANRKARGYAKEAEAVGTRVETSLATFEAMRQSEDTKKLYDFAIGKAAKIGDSPLSDELRGDMAMTAAEAYEHTKEKRNAFAKILEAVASTMVDPNPKAKHRFVFGESVWEDRSSNYRQSLKEQGVDVDRTENAILFAKEIFELVDPNEFPQISVNENLDFTKPRVFGNKWDLFTTGEFYPAHYLDTQDGQSVRLSVRYQKEQTILDETPAKVYVDVSKMNPSIEVSAID